MGNGLAMGITYGILFYCWAILLWHAETLMRSGTTNCGMFLSTTFTVTPAACTYVLFLFYLCSEYKLLK
jgi:hypothetical protein